MHEYENVSDAKMEIKAQLDAQEKNLIINGKILDSATENAHLTGVQGSNYKNAPKIGVPRDSASQQNHTGVSGQSEHLTQISEIVPGSEFFHQ